MDYSTSDYLTQLQQDREDLVDNLEAKGITGLTGDETFTTLVPKVLDISGGSEGVYRVDSYEEMLEITDMQDGDLCIFTETYTPSSTPDYNKLSLATVRKLSNNTLGETATNTYFNGTYGFYSYIYRKNDLNQVFIETYFLTPKVTTSTSYYPNSGSFNNSSGANYYVDMDDMTVNNTGSFTNRPIIMIYDNNILPAAHPANSNYYVYSTFAQDMTVTNITTDFLDYTDYDDWGIVDFNKTKIYIYQTNQWIKIYEIDNSV